MSRIRPKARIDLAIARVQHKVRAKTATSSRLSSLAHTDRAPLHPLDTLNILKSHVSILFRELRVTIFQSG